MSLLQSVAFRMSAVIINPLDAGDVAAPQGGMPFDILSNWVLSHLANVDELHGSCCILCPLFACLQFLLWTCTAKNPGLI